MRQIKIPALKFSPWYAWAERDKLPQSDKPGGYLIAISEKSLENKPVAWPDVSYIGMTHSQQGLKGRWNQFYYSISGKKAHSGGKTAFNDPKLPDYKNWDKLGIKMYVAAMPIDCNVANPTDVDYLKMGWVNYLEYEAFAEFYRHCPKRGKPKYNTR